MKAILLIFFLATGFPTCVQLKQRHELEERASKAARTLQNIYILTPNQSVRIVCANAWKGNLCMEYVVDDARSQPIIRYAVAEKDSRSVEYDLDQENAAASCNAADIDLTSVAEEAAR